MPLCDPEYNKTSPVEPVFNSETMAPVATENRPVDESTLDTLLIPTVEISPVCKRIEPELALTALPVMAEIEPDKFNEVVNGLVTFPVEIETLPEFPIPPFWPVNIDAVPVLPTLFAFNTAPVDKVEEPVLTVDVPTPVTLPDCRVTLPLFPETTAPTTLEKNVPEETKTFPEFPVAVAPETVAKIPPDPKLATPEFPVTIAPLNED
jgi:hypothetical protein